MVVITGGTKGIGLALIHKFAAKGHDIATCARNKEDLENLKKELVKQYGIEVFIQSTDVSVREDLATFVDFVKRIEKPIDVLINNAGMFIPGAIHDEAEGSLEKMIETNLYSAYHVTRGLIGEMITKKAGHIINICSIASFEAYPNGGSYAISKHAMWGFSKSLREEMKPHGVRVTSVLPGATYTASWEGVDLPPERFIKPEDVAEIVYTSHKVSAQTVTEDIIIRPQLGDI
ncbi:SDR family oxidoreductase [Flammeovirgaceae bacterium SG7u.111]|nr:SDR family oxidoreductase [Flammeovirgaceae bacterium SG7u.132]WPO38174.1 SDR family oxidoreductase [Flammeovirgaceae bacterium SG7u.111]